MGIKGLRAALKECQLVDGHIRDWAGKTVVVDGYAWLHKGAYSCATALCMGEETEAYLKFPMHLIAMMKFYGVEPIVVLDGSSLPGKAGTNQARREKRQSLLAKGKELHAEGIVGEAERAFQSAVSVTAEMARKFHSCLTAEDVRCYIAPFEADAQMARMVLDGIAAAAVTEDSDLIPYGVESCIYKLDRYGNCTVVTKESLANKSKTSLDISHMTKRQRVQLCILAGCDYLPSIEGIGIRKALEFMRKFRDAYSVIRAIRARGKHPVPDGYEESFRRAEVTFACHRVYDIALAKVVPLSGIPEGIEVTDAELMAILGPCIQDDLARAFCEQALIDPRTMEKWPPILRKPKPPSSTRGPSKFVPQIGGISKSFADRPPGASSGMAGGVGNKGLMAAGRSKASGNNTQEGKWKKKADGRWELSGDKGKAAGGGLKAMFAAQAQVGKKSKTIDGTGLWGGGGGGMGAGGKRAGVEQGSEGGKGSPTSVKPKKRKLVGFGSDGASPSSPCDLVSSMTKVYGKATSSPSLAVDVGRAGADGGGAASILSFLGQESDGHVGVAAAAARVRSEGGVLTSGGSTSQVPTVEGVRRSESECGTGDGGVHGEKDAMLMGASCSSEADDDGCGGHGVVGGHWRREQDRDAQTLFPDAGYGDGGLGAEGAGDNLTGVEVEEEVAVLEEREQVEMVEESGQGQASRGTSEWISEGEGEGGGGQGEADKQGIVVDLCDEEEENVALVPSSPAAARKTSQSLFGVAATTNKTPQTLKKGKAAWGSLGNWGLPSGPGPAHATAAQGSVSGGGASSGMMKVMRPMMPGAAANSASFKRGKSATAKAKPKPSGKMAKGSMDAFVKRL